MSIDSIRINTDVIGRLMGKSSEAKLQFPELQKQGKLYDVDIYTAIEMVACEDKIEIKTDAIIQRHIYRLPVIYSQYY